MNNSVTSDSKSTPAASIVQVTLVLWRLIYWQSEVTSDTLTRSF